MTTYTVLPQQSLLDIALEVYGDATGVFWLLDDNPGLTEVADRLYAGQVLTVRADTLNPRTQAYLSVYGPFQTIDETDKPGGIGYWRLEEYVVDFPPLHTVHPPTVYV